MVLNALAKKDFKQQFQLLKQHFESYGKCASVSDQVREIKSFTIAKTATRFRRADQPWFAKSSCPSHSQRFVVSIPFTACIFY
jgi:hypothetical protein